MFDNQFIPKVKFDPEKVSSSTIAHDFHYINKDGKSTSPWFNFDAIQKRNVSQKNVFTFSAIPTSHDFNEVDKESHDTILESVTELDLVATEDKEDLLVAYKRSVTSDIHKKQAHRSRKIQYETYGDDIKKELTNEPAKLPKVRKKTIKIPFSLFSKIHNFRYPPILSGVNTNSLPQIEAPVEQEIVSQSERTLGMEDILKTNHNNRLDIHPKVYKKTLKIPFTLFAKIHNFRYPPILNEGNMNSVPQIEALVSQEIMSHSEHNLEREDILEFNHNNKLDIHPKVNKKTLKIPFSLFSKIHNYGYPSILNEAKTKSASQIEAGLKQEIVSQSGHNLEKEDRLELTAPEDILELNHTNEAIKHTKVSKKTIKIPFTGIQKIRDIRYSSISLNEISSSELQPETGLEQEIVSQSEHNLEKEDILERSAPENILDINHTNEPIKHTKVSKKTIKTPFTVVQKIHSIHFTSISLNGISSSELQLATGVEQELVSQSEHNLEKEDILELTSAENILDINHTNEAIKHTNVSKKTLTIPFTVIQKIRDIRYSSISLNEISSSELQPKTGVEQEIVSQSEHNLEKEDMIVLDASTDHSNDGNNNIRDNGEENHSKKLSGQTETRLRRLKIPFSTFAEIDNFLHHPIFGSTMQNTFKFINPSDNKIPQLDTKLFDTITYYHEQPYCHLIGFKSHELIFSFDEKNVGRERKNKQKDSNRAVAVPIHDSLSIKEGETNNAYSNHKYVYAKVPVVIGEYNMEVCLDEDVLFEESIYQVKEISKVVKLTNCEFIPTKFSPSTASRDRIALTGKLFIEGDIYQSIEYTAIAKMDENSELIKGKQPLNPLHQNIVIELIIQLLQVQTVINQQLTSKEGV